MIRIGWIVLVSLPFVIYYYIRICYMDRHLDRYTEEYRYRMARKVMCIMKVNGFIHTRFYGLENLPKEGGYIMYPNHQGKYDVPGIMIGHKAPCTFLIDDARADLLFTHEIVQLVGAKRLDKTDRRAQLTTILQMAEEVRAGRRYIIFAEGGYDHNGNELQDFLPGAFKCAIKAKCPIVPVVLIDSYKVFGRNSLRPVHTQVHFCPPIPYAEYQGMNTHELAKMVRGRIEEIMEEEKRRRSHRLHRLYTALRERVCG